MFQLLRFFIEDYFLKINFFMYENCNHMRFDNLTILTQKSDFSARNLINCYSILSHCRIFWKRLVQNALLKNYHIKSNSRKNWFRTYLLSQPVNERIKDCIDRDELRTEMKLIFRVGGFINISLIFRNINLILIFKVISGRNWNGRNLDITLLGKKELEK